MALYEIELLLEHFEAHEVRKQSLKAEEILFRFGEPIDRIFFILDGEVRAETYDQEGQPIVFFRASKGQALSEESLYLSHYLYSAIGSSPETTLVSVPKNRLHASLSSNPKAFDHFVSCLAQRYSDALISRELIGIRSADIRLLTWLNWKINRSTSPNTLDLSGRMGALSGDLGLSREAVYRAFKSLEDSGSITRNKGVITVHNFHENPASMKK